jgi:translation initiation factor 4E
MAEQVDLKTIPVTRDGEENEVEAIPADLESKLVTVFHDKDNFNVKHPLQNKWTLWFTKPSSGKVGRPSLAVPPPYPAPGHAC